jgi:iron complex transport system substrate-binding protein
LQVQGFAPDVLLLCPCSRSPAAAMPDVQRLVALPGFGQLPAVLAEQVFLIDHAWFSRPGPRLIDGVELLASLLYGVQQCGGVTSGGHAVLRIKARGNGGFDWVPV